MKNSEYLFAYNKDACFLKLKGKTDYINCLPFKEFIDQIIQDKYYKYIFIDLNELDSIDSTNLGLLAKCGEYTLETFNNKSVIFCKNDDIKNQLKCIGFENVFILLEDKFDKKKYMDKIQTNTKMTEERLSDILLDAHSKLIDIDCNNEKKFKDVIDVLKNKYK